MDFQVVVLAGGTSKKLLPLVSKVCFLIPSPASSSLSVCFSRKQLLNKRSNFFTDDDLL
jgi:hypothetical protein